MLCIYVTQPSRNLQVSWGEKMHTMKRHKEPGRGRAEFVVGSFSEKLPVGVSLGWLLSG